MAEGSAFWDGTVTGDAAGSVWAGAYSYAEHADFFSKLLASNQAAGYVVPGKDNELEVTSIPGNGMGVLVKSGAAFIRGLVYENTTTTVLTVDAADPTNPRLDRVILRITWASQTIRAAILKGTANSNPALPALTQNATTYEIELATLYVASSTNFITSEDIWDKRKFVANSYARRISSKTNNILNSEYLAFASAAKQMAQFWYGSNTAGSYAMSTHPGVTRGKTITINSATGFYQDIQVKPSTRYTLKCLVSSTSVTSGLYISVVTDSGSPTSILKHVRKINVTNTQFEFLIYFTTEVDATSVRITFYNSGLVVGGTLLCEGILPGPFREIPEFLPFQGFIVEGNYLFATPANATMDFSTEFESGKGVPPGTRAALFNVISKAATAAGNGYYGIKSRDTGSKLAFEMRMHDNISTHEWSCNGWVAIYDRKAYIKTANLDGQVTVLLQGLIT